MQVVTQMMMQMTMMERMEMMQMLRPPPNRQFHFESRRASSYRRDRFRIR